MKNFSLVELTTLVFAALLFGACTKTQQVAVPDAQISNVVEAAAKPAANETIRFLENRVKQNSEDFIAYNKLASEYIQQMRETGDVTYLNLASRAAESSLAVLPPEQNKGGLASRVLVEYATHDFAGARDDAKKLIEIEPDRGYSYQMLGDALVELGQYAEAKAAFEKMQEFGGIQIITQSAMQQRLARFAFLHGDLKTAAKRYSIALKLAQSTPAPPETVAYCQWQSGETAFAAGDFKTAENFYRDSLATFPGYPKALASMGQVSAAQGDLNGAIDYYEQASNRFPDLNFIAALGDLYKLAGREQDAAKQYELAEQIGHLSELNGAIYNRSLAMFYADHDLKPEAAYQMAAKEFENRRDIYGADAVAWTAVKSGKLSEAQAAIKEALKLGTNDARLFYHAGTIAQAAGDTTAARKNFQRALALNPKFGILQSEICRRNLENLQKG